MKRQCMVIAEGGRKYICIKDDKARVNPYKIYREEWYNGGKHRQKEEEYANFESVIWWLEGKIKDCPEWR